MSAFEEYIVVPFVLARKRRLTPGTPQTFVNAERAKQVAAGLQAIHAGVMVLEQTGDSASGALEEPRLIWHAGDIPEELLQFA